MQALRGEFAVLCKLLRASDAVLETIVPEDTDEGEKLDELRAALDKAIRQFPNLAAGRLDV